MGSTETVVTFAFPPNLALEHCVRVLTEQRFKNIVVGDGLVAAQRREPGQWTRGGITLAVTPDREGSRVTITAEAGAQSLVGLASSPSSRMVKRVAQALPTD
jgi:hypothetical protein